MVYRTKKYNYMFYRGLYGGIDWIPFFYNTKEYKEIGWLVWVFTIHLNSEPNSIKHMKRWFK